MPRTKDSVHQHFVETDDKSLRCNECQGYTTKTRDRQRLMAHMAGCEGITPQLREVYQQRNAANKDTRTASKRPRTDTTTTIPIIGLGNTIATSSVSGAANTPRIERWVDTVSPSDQRQLERSLAEWVFTSGLPFNIVEHSGFREFMAKARPEFQVPSRKIMAGPMLYDSY